MKLISRFRWFLFYWISLDLLIFCLFALGLTYYDRDLQFQFLGNLSAKMIEHDPKSQAVLMESLKELSTGSRLEGNENPLTFFGYRTSDFFPVPKGIVGAMILCFLLGLLCFFLAWFYQKQSFQEQIKKLRMYLEQVNRNQPGSLLENTEGEIAWLQDEIYKTVTMLYQTRETLEKEKENLADNLANIAHQIKNPITSISLSTQMMKKNRNLSYVGSIEKQLDRLTYLEEALLLLSRIDAGTLIFKKEPVDVFSLLVLAAENLETLAIEANRIEIIESEAMTLFVDRDWMLEALMNLMKNGLEHTDQGSVVYCSYEKNPLYRQIRIWDQGKGFLLEDLPHLFERFYRGKHAQNKGIGIGLSIAKAIIEEQNGIIRAFNLPEGGACFEIRFYSH